MAIQAFKLGALAQDSVANIKCIVASPSATSNYMTFETPVGTDYQVTAGKTFYVTKVIWQPGTAGDNFILGYGDDGVANGAAAPTNWIQMTGILKPQLQSANVGEYDIIVPILASKFPCAKSIAGSQSITIFGIEVTN